MVLLRHTLPDGSSHYDWMFARRDPVAPDDRELLTFRVGERVDQLVGATVSAQRLPDHRGRYLTYEGPVSGDRGEVVRVASGRCAILRDTQDLAVIRFAWDAGATFEATAVATPGGDFLLTIAPFVDTPTPKVR